MLVKMLITRAGRMVYNAGQEYDLPDTEARNLIKHGQAVAVEPEVETAMLPPSKPRRKKQ